jgi:hypothetical protein
MQQEHIPEMLATQKFIDTKIFKIISDQDSGGVSYAVQYHCENRQLFEAYLKENAPQLRNKAQTKFGDQILFFRTELEQIQKKS